MADDRARAVPQSVIHATADDVALPVPRPPVLEAPASDTDRPAPPPSLVEPAPRDIGRLARKPERGSRTGWIVTSVAAAGAAWAVGWISGVFWAWRAMTPRYLHHSQVRRGARLSG